MATGERRRPAISSVSLQAGRKVGSTEPIVCMSLADFQLWSTLGYHNPSASCNSRYARSPVSEVTTEPDFAAVSRRGDDFEPDPCTAANKVLLDYLVGKRSSLSEIVSPSGDGAVPSMAVVRRRRSARSSPSR